mgnify:CR=1 FL=1
MLSNEQIQEWLDMSNKPTRKCTDGKKAEYHLARTAVPALCQEVMSRTSQSGEDGKLAVLKELGKLRYHMVEYNTSYSDEVRSACVEIIDRFIDRVA